VASGPHSVPQGHDVGSVWQYERNPHTTSLVSVIRREPAVTRLPSDGYRLNASKSESMARRLGMFTPLPQWDRSCVPSTNLSAAKGGMSSQKASVKSKPPWVCVAKIRMASCFSAESENPQDPRFGVGIHRLFHRLFHLFGSSCHGSTDCHACGVLSARGGQQDPICGCPCSLVLHQDWQ